MGAWQSGFFLFVFFFWSLCWKCHLSASHLPVFYVTQRQIPSNHMWQPPYPTHVLGVAQPLHHHTRCKLSKCLSLRFSMMNTMSASQWRKRSRLLIWTTTSVRSSWTTCAKVLGQLKKWKSTFIRERKNISVLGRYAHLRSQELWFVTKCQIELYGMCREIKRFSCWRKTKRSQEEVPLFSSRSCSSGAFLVN